MIKGLGLVIGFYVYKIIIKRVDLHSVSQALYHPNVQADWESQNREGNDSKFFNDTRFTQTT